MEFLVCLLFSGVDRGGHHKSFVIFVRIFLVSSGN